MNTILNKNYHNNVPFIARPSCIASTTWNFLFIFVIKISISSACGGTTSLGLLPRHCLFFLVVFVRRTARS